MITMKDASMNTLLKILSKFDYCFIDFGFSSLSI